MRTINAPGIELNEIDLSKQDEQYKNRTGVFITGFADRGEDYTIKNIRSMKEFIQTYGYPTNEAERYFYNSAKEAFSLNAFNTAGNLYTAKLPYDNESLDKISYTTYTVKPYSYLIKDKTDFLNAKSYDNIALSSIITSTNKKHTTGVVAKTFYEFITHTCTFDYRVLTLVKNLFYTSKCFYNLSSLYAGIAENLYNYNKDDIGSYDYFINQDYNMKVYESLITTGNFESYDDCINAYLKSLTMTDITAIVESLRIKSQLSDSVNEILIDNDLSSKSYKYTDIKDLDDSITSFIEINSKTTPNSSGLMTFDEYDSLITKSYDIPENDIIIVNTSRAKYDRDVYFEHNNPESKYSSQYIGIVPVITTAANAIFYQDLLNDKFNMNYKNYSAISDFKVIDNDNEINRINSDAAKQRFSLPLASSKLNDESISNNAIKYFPKISFSTFNKLDKTFLKQIGIVVFKMYLNPSNNLIDFSPVESFLGSLDNRARNITTGGGLFIDDIVNKSSKYINVFSNVKFYKNSYSELDDSLNSESLECSTEIDRSSLIAIGDQKVTSLGFFANQSAKNISKDVSIENALDIILAHASNVRTYNIDLIVDCGVSNIAQYIVTTKRNIYNPEDDIFNLFKLNNESSVYEWRKILSKFDDFCRLDRKDCMFIADGLRNFCIEGNSKIVRKSKPANTIKNSVISKIKFLSGIDSSYSTGYCNWFFCKDEFSEKMFWCPPSIKAYGRYLYTDFIFNPWDAPAGFKRGVISNVYDVAFNPTNDEAGIIYSNFWNYSISYPLNGIILEGQRTFQRNKTAFDRVNVRRLFLYVEKQISHIANYFLYDGITSSRISLFKDLIKTELNKVKNNDGLYEYYIVCDERNNNAETADNNEIHCSIAIRPVKTAEFIVLNFLCSNQTANLEEITTSVL